MLSIITTIVIGLLVFTFLVVIHEFGHFIVARLSGVKVEEFALGMGPKLFGFQGKETLYSIRALPLGGFCKMLGEDENNQDPRAFNNKHILKRIGIIAFGPIMNFIFTILILSMIIAAVPVVNRVSVDSPASKAGIIAGDEITEINGTAITEWDQIRPIVDANKGKEINVKYKRNGKIEQINLVPAPRVGEEGAMIGIEPSIVYQGFSLSEGVSNTILVSKEMYKFIGKAIVGQAQMQYVEGPIKIVKRVGEAAQIGIEAVLQFAGFISLNLAIINLLPFPALDGGRLMFLFIEAIRRKPVDPQKEGLVHFIGFVLLMILSVFILYRDIITL